MRKLIPAAAAAVGLFAGAALAEEVTGTVEMIDTTRNVMTVDGQQFNVAPNNVVGLTLEELQVGDTVTVTYQEGGGDDPTSVNAMTVEKAE